MTLDGHLGHKSRHRCVATCQRSGSNHLESLQLSCRLHAEAHEVYPVSHSSPGKATLPYPLPLAVRNDAGWRTKHAAKTCRSTYWRCGNDDGHFIGFSSLKEKNSSIHCRLSRFKELRQNVSLECSNCGASINLESDLFVPSATRPSPCSI